VSREQALSDIYSEAQARKIEIRTGPEAEAYLDYAAKQQGISPEKMHASTLGQDLIMVRESHAGDVRTLREELLHTQQQVPGFEASVASRTQAEIQVREQMIQNRQRWGLTNAEVRELVQEIRTIRQRGVY